MCKLIVHKLCNTASFSYIKLGVVNSYVFKFYPCARSLEDAQWRKCITCTAEFLRRKKRYTRVD